MNPATLIPAADPLTVPSGWFQFLLMLTFPLHLLAMNALLGTALTALAAHLLPGQPYRRLSHELAKALPFLVAFTVNLGVAPLLFLNVLYGNLFYTSTILMGLFWLAVIPLVIIAYYLLYLYDFRFRQLGNGAMFVLLAVLALLLLVGFVFSNNMTMMIAPAGWNRWFTTPGGTLLNLADPTLLPRYLHMMTGALAVGGLCAALYAKIALKDDPETAAAGIRLGMGLFSWLSLLQVVLGVWFLTRLQPAVLRLFMGGSGSATALLTIGLLMALAALMAGFRHQVGLAAGLTLPLLYVMAFMRDTVRTGALAPYFSLDKVPVTSQVQWSPLVLFLVTLVLGLAVIAWMLGKVATCTARGEGQTEEESDN